MQRGMTDAAQHHIAAGQAALTAGDWHAARTAYEAALSEQACPEAHDGWASHSGG